MVIDAALVLDGRAASFPDGDRFGDEPDGNGKVCQCGDVNDDARTNLADAFAIFRSKSWRHRTALAAPEKCNVVGPADRRRSCNLRDAFAILYDVLGWRSRVQRVCTSALP